jgi:Helix-turn-helix domain
MRYYASEKLGIIRTVESSHLPVKRTLDMLGIPRPTFYRWYDRYVEGGLDALADRSPRPKSVWNRIPHPRQPSWGSSWGFFGGFRPLGSLPHWWRGVGWDGRIPCRGLVLLGFGFDLGLGGAAVGAILGVVRWELHPGPSLDNP